MSDREITKTDNNPPEELPPEDFMVLRKAIDEQLAVSNKWVTERPKITDEAMADACKGHIDQLRAQFKEAEELRKAEVKPLNDQKAGIQERYKKLSERIQTAAEILKGRMTPWLEKLAVEQKAREEKAAKEARQAAAAAEAARQEAEKALEEAKPGTDALGALDAASAAEDEAKAAKKAASAAAKAKPQAGSGTGGRAMSLQTVYSAVLKDPHRVTWFFKDDPGVRETVQAAANRVAQADKDKAVIPGAEIHTEQKARS